MSTGEDILGAALRLGALFAETLASAARAGDVSTLDALREVLRDPDALAELDRLLVAAQRAKAEAELRGSGGS